MKELSRQFGCKVVEISALKGTGIMEAAEAAIDAANNTKTIPTHSFSGPVEHAIAHIEEAAVHDLPEEQQRWYAIKIFERDDKVLEQLNIPEDKMAHIENDIKAAEKELDDDSESIITNERYIFIANAMKSSYKKKSAGKMTTSDKIDRIVTNRWLGLPIFALIMIVVYYVSMVTVGAAATDWVNDGVFGDGFHLFGIGTSKYEEAAEEYGDTNAIMASVVDEYGDDAMAEALDSEDGLSDDQVAALKAAVPADAALTYELEDEETLEVTEEEASYEDITASLDKYGSEPDPSEYGVWVPGIPSLIESLLDKVGCADWLKGLILDGIVAGVGAVLGFVPQMLVLFFFLAFLESCGYMARIAFVLDRIFRKFGLSGKSFIPMLVGTGCGIPGIMASRTIENERDRRMTIMTTTFIPCGAKVPFIAMIAGAIFGGSAIQKSIVSVSAYFVGMAAIIISGIILKKTKPFAGEPAPFVMELPAYHLPTISNILRSTWERGWSFIKKAGTVILLSTIFVWFTTYFGVVDGSIKMLEEDQLDMSFLANIGSVLAWVFKPLGWGNWQAAVASITGLVAKENIVGTMGILYGGGDKTVYQTLASVFTGVTGYSFLVFNLLCAPCFAAIGAIKREMNNWKWTTFAVAYECGFAYVIAFLVTQIGNIFFGSVNVVGLIIAIALVGLMGYLLFRPYKEAEKLSVSVKV